MYICTKKQKYGNMPYDGLQERYVNFYTDFAFKKLFGTEANKDLLISFLNSLLNGEEVIKDLTYLNAEQLGTQEYDRKAVFDVYCENEKGEKFIVEMQKAEQQFFKDRSVFYATFPIREQAPKGSWDYELKSVYTIGILNFSFDDSDPEYYHHEVKLVDMKTKKVFYDKLTFIYLEMTKFNKSENELESLFDKWLYAMKTLPLLMERPKVLQDKVFKHFFEAAEISKFTPHERIQYEESLKNYRDWYSVMKTAKTKSHAEGLAEGLAKGLAKGREEGREEGVKTNKIDMARKMKQAGLDVNIISQITGLPAKDIDDIQ
jgi:predicted transposase/invertase (TIGR01784 family)